MAWDSVSILNYTKGLSRLKGLITERNHVHLAYGNIVPSEFRSVSQRETGPWHTVIWLSGPVFCFPRNTLVGWFLLFCHLPWDGQHGTLSSMLKCWFFFFINYYLFHIWWGGSMYLIAITDFRKMDSSGCVFFCVSRSSLWHFIAVSLFDVSVVYFKIEVRGKKKRRKQTPYFIAT